MPPQTQNHPWLERNFSGGLVYDVAAQIASLITDSSYIEAQNMRMNGINTTQIALTKIKGEQLLYPLIGNAPVAVTGYPQASSGAALATTYICVGACSCNGYLFEIWADSAPITPEPPFVRINGLIVLYSPAFLATAFNYFNTHANQSEQGGLIAATDSVDPPYLFNIVDLLNNAGINYLTGQVDNGTFPPTQKYFSGFLLSLITQSLLGYCDHPVFIQVATSPPAGSVVLGSGGLAVGLYQYAIELVTASGDTLNFSVPTPLIPVLGGLSSSAYAYPWTKTYGLTAGTLSAFGIHFRFRVTNLVGYTAVNILRVAYNNGYQPSAPAPLDIIATLPIVDGLSIIDCFDFGATATSTITDLGTSNTLSVLESTTSNRFFGRRLYYGAPTYQSKDLSNDITFTDASGTPCYAQTVNLGMAGHKHPYNFTYFRHSQTGEQYAYGAVFFDQTFAPTFAIPVPMPSGNPAAPTGFQFPNRRDPEQITGVGSTTAALTNNTVGKCYEVFDTVDALPKDGSLTAMHSVIVNDSAGYTPLYPTGDGDNRLSSVAGQVDWNYPITEFVYPDNSTQTDYTPFMFGLNYHAAGLAIKGINTIPDFIGGFSIARTERANRVIAQGLATYGLSTSGLSGSTATKNLQGFYCYFPDQESGLVDINSLDLSSGRYYIQFVSPLGFASEVYSFFNVPGTPTPTYPPGGQNIDMISYARVLRESGSINVGDSATTNGINGGDGFGYTSYGYWRSPTSGGGYGGAWASGDMGNNIFKIIGGVTQELTSTRGSFYEITLDNSVHGNIYNTNTITNGTSFNGARAWHEPIYVVNLIDTAAGLPQNVDVTDYIDTGTFIKTVSLIGLGTGATIQNYLLVDERVEDVTDFSGGTGSWVLGKYFINVRDQFGNLIPWVDVTGCNSGQLTTAYAAIIGGTYGGAYTVTQNTIDVPLNVEYTVVFDAGVFASIGHPTVSTPNGQVLVYYNPLAPIEVFGGDTTIGEASFALIDTIMQDGGAGNPLPPAPATDIGWIIPSPYYQYALNANYHLDNQSGGGNYFICTLNSIRQYIWMFTAEAKTCLPFDFTSTTPGDYVDRMFPNVNYIMKPTQWQSEPAYEIVPMPQYFDDYPEMVTGGSNTDVFTTEIRYGGFRYSQNDIDTVIDYSHEANQFQYFSKPSVNFVEQNSFNDRFIWSDQRIPNEQDVPGFQTFPAANYFDLSEDTGGINFLWDGYTKKGSNLYAFTDNGVCLAVTNQFITQQNTGDQALIINDGTQEGVLQEVWLSKTVGLPYQMWRSAAENNNVLFFTNNHSSYKLVDNEVIDIARQKYFTRIYGDVLSNQDGMNDIGIAGVFDTGNNEYWAGFKLHTLNMNSAPTVNLGITNNYNYYEYNLIGSPVEVYMDVTMGSVFYFTNNNTNSAGVPLVDAATSTTITIVYPGQTVEVFYNGLINYDVTVLNNFYTYPFDTSQFTETYTSLTIYWNNVLQTYTPSLPVTYNSLTDIVQTLNSQFNFSGAVVWYVWGTNIVATVAQGSGILGEFSIIFTGGAFDSTPTMEVQFPFTDITFSYFDETTIIVPSSEVQGTRQSWNGFFTYDFDKYVCIDNVVYGMKSGGTYIIGKSGYLLNGEPMVASVLQATAGSKEDGKFEKELLKVRVDNDLLATSIPTRIEFYDSLDQYRAGEIQCFLDTSIYATALKPYYGFEGWVPRRNTGNTAHFQNNVFLYQIIHSTDNPFFVTLTGVQYKRLK